MKVSLITVTYNRALQFYRGIRTVLDQEIIPNEIVVIDDGSSDNTKEMFDKLVTYTKDLGLDINWHYIWLNHPEPRISCIPRNVGIKKATGDVIIFTEPEALHVNNTISQLLNKLEQNPNNTILASQVWTIGPRIYQKLSEDDFLKPARIINHPYAMLTDGGNLNNTKAPDSDFAITGESNCNAGVLFATRKQWLEDIGGFDEEFKGHGFDDFDLFNRLAMYGKGILKDPNIIVIHQWHDKSFYPYNTIDAGIKNGKKSEERAKAGEYRANIGQEWGIE